MVRVGGGYVKKSTSHISMRGRAVVGVLVFRRGVAFVDEKAVFFDPELAHVILGVGLGAIRRNAHVRNVRTAVALQQFHTYVAGVFFSPDHNVGIHSFSPFDLVSRRTIRCF